MRLAPQVVMVLWTAFLALVLYRPHLVVELLQVQRRFQSHHLRQWQPQQGQDLLVGSEAL